MSTKRERMQQQIERHAANLDAIFPSAKKHGVALAKALRRYEVEASRHTLALCNVPNYQETADVALEVIGRKVAELLGDGDPPIIINRDPRGYALKIDAEIVSARKLDIGRDGGGDAPLAPEFDGSL